MRVIFAKSLLYMFILFGIHQYAATTLELKRIDFGKKRTISAGSSFKQKRSKVSKKQSYRGNSEGTSFSK